MIKKFAIVMVLAAVSLTNGQWTDSDGVLISDIQPEFKYYPSDAPAGTVDQYGLPIVAGSFTVVTAGPNGVVDSADNNVRVGDDNGFISGLVSMPVDPMPGQTLDTFVDGIGWNAPVWFNNSVQLSGQGFGGQFLPASELETIIFSLPAGLTAEDFVDADTGMIEIETGVNEAPGMPGRTLFASIDPTATGAGTGFSIVPEPSSFALLSIALLAGLGLRRRS